MHAQQEAGIDVMELGVPFSDPVADGPVIQNASYEAIQNGATLAKVFELMKKVRNEGLSTPVVFMMYYINKKWVLCRVRFYYSSELLSSFFMSIISYKYFFLSSECLIIIEA